MQNMDNIRIQYANKITVRDNIHAIYRRHSNKIRTTYTQRADNMQTKYRHTTNKRQTT